jgi:hypothetical protein
MRPRATTAPLAIMPPMARPRPEPLSFLLFWEARKPSPAPMAETTVPAPQSQTVRKPRKARISAAPLREAYDALSGIQLYAAVPGSLEEVGAMWQQLSRSEKWGVVVWLGLFVAQVVLAIFFVWFGRWVIGVGPAVAAVACAYHGYRTATSASKNRGSGKSS